MAQEKYTNYESLKYYDTKLKAWVTAADAEALKQSKEYADSLGDNYDAAGTAQTKVDELANGQVKANTDAIAKLNGDATVEGSVAKAIADSKANIDTDIATAQAKADAAKSAAEAAQTDVDALEAKVGTVPDGQTVMGIVTNIQESAYDDTAIKALIKTNADDIDALETRTTAAEAKATANETAITTLNGTGIGSIKKQIDDAFNDFATKISDDNVVNTYKELIDYCATHGAETAEMAGDIAANAAAIDTLEKFVGTLPEGTLATDVIAYINEKITAEQNRATNAESGLANRLTTIEDKLGTGTGSIAEQIATAKQEAIAAAATDATTKANAAETNAKTYTDTEIAKIDLSGIDANATEITTLKTKISAAETDIDTLETAVNTTLPTSIADAKKAGTDAQADVDALETTVNTLSGKVTTNETSISSQGDRLTTLEGKVGDGFVAITNAEIDSMFTTSETN